MMTGVGSLDMDTFFVFVKKLPLHLLEQYSLVASHPCYHFSLITKPPIFPIALSLPVQMEIDC
jgi:hypothetical protein